MTLVQVTAPVATPVTIQDAREQCSLFDDSTHDSLLVRLIKTATREAEVYLDSILMARTMRLDLDGFPGRDVDLRTYPIESITSVKYDDADNAEQTVPGSDYYTSLNGLSPKLRAVTSWPSTYPGKLSRVRITFEAGYADSDSVPDDIKHAILVRVYELWRERGELLIGVGVTSVKINPFHTLLAPSRRLSV